MPGQYHFSKGAYKSCDVKTPFMTGVILANKRMQMTICEEFKRKLAEMGVTKTFALKDLRSQGALVSHQNFDNYRKGIFWTCSTTYLNILSRYVGYDDANELLCVVRDRELGHDQSG